MDEENKLGSENCLAVMAGVGSGALLCHSHRPRIVLDKKYRYCSFEVLLIVPPGFRHKWALYLSEGEVDPGCLASAAVSCSYVGAALGQAGTEFFPGQKPAPNLCFAPPEVPAL